MNMVANGTHPHKREISWDDFASGDLPSHEPPVDEQRLDYFRQAVMQAAATMDTPPYNDAKSKLSKAMDLVLSGKVQAHESGLYGVQGSKKVYSVNGECPCPQGQSKASKWCKHMVAVELWKRASQIMQPTNANGNGHHPEPEPSPQPVPTIPDCDSTRHWTDVLAPICHTVKYVVDGIEHVTVIRGDDMGEVMAQVKALTCTIKKGREAESVPTEDIPYCDTHKCHFERHSNAKGSWFSHKTADGWCRYNGGKA